MLALKIKVLSSKRVCWRIAENCSVGQRCNTKARGGSNKGEARDFLEKKVDVGRVVLIHSPLEKSESSEWGWFLSELLGW